MRRLPLSHVLTASATAAVLAGVGIATGAIPGPDGQIQACYDQHGNVRIAQQASDCKKHETAIAWNQRGPAGPRGAIGPPGPPGTPGGSGDTVALSFGYPSVGDCGSDATPDHPSSHPCPFRVIDAPAGVRVTFVRNTFKQPVGYCVGGLASVPRSVIAQLGSESEDAQGRFTGVQTELSGAQLNGVDPGVEIQQPPSFCPSGSQFIVLWNQADTLGGADCSHQSSGVPCNDVVYRLILG